MEASIHIVNNTSVLNDVTEMKSVSWLVGNINVSARIHRMHVLQIFAEISLAVIERYVWK